MLKRSKIVTGLGIFLILWLTAWYLHGMLAEHHYPPPHSDETRSLQVEADNASFGPREYIRIRKAEWNQEEQLETLPKP
ncbi:hypothetical protein XYCOK13_29760 [Xylanibacillus composti]|uniref:Uncharacterized protein n=1 Tax=Xylanibacillus composti TaxID=1572762 RepID=A0A8J4H5X9_9BACL|nr:hypothetical protein [Xylanibacillus composti]GIQ70152.1 hypothetical protein XYCOK13_29760 [Xylanibacillus composti]